MKVVVLGGGMLAKELSKSSSEDIDLVQLTRDSLDITRAEKVSKTILELKPDVVVNAAAYTQVDRAEDEPDKAYAVNRDAVGYIARACAMLHCRFIHVSTDFVFDGVSSVPYKPEDKKSPLGVYGRSKSEGEDVLREEMEADWVIIRTSWVYSVYANNFVKTMLRLMKERDELLVVDDQIGSPTWAQGLARFIWQVVRLRFSGILHWSDSGGITWFDFANAIQKNALALGLLDRAISIKPVSTEEFGAKAPRPAYSVLNCTNEHLNDGSGHADTSPKPQSWDLQLKSMLEQFKRLS